MPTSPLRALLAVVWLVASVGLAACAADSGPSLSRSSAPATLAGTAWTAIMVAGQPTVPGSEPTAHFTADRVDGTTGCNRYGGSYEYAAGVIKLGQLMSTLMGCDGAIGATEMRFNTALAGASTVAIDPEGRLVLDGTSGAITFVVAPQQTGG